MVTPTRQAKAQIIKQVIPGEDAQRKGYAGQTDGTGWETPI